mgnify:CR=1 FL=1
MHVLGQSKICYIFSFEHAHDLQLLIAYGPCAVARALLIVDYWRPGLLLEKFVIPCARIWVLMFGLLLESYTAEAGFCLGKAIGEVI